MNTKVKPKGGTFRVQKVARGGKSKTFSVTKMPSGAKVVTMKKGTFSSAKDAAAKALSKHKVPA